MFPSDLAQLLPTLLLALAIFTGLPALFYLAYKGTLRQAEKPKPATEPEQKTVEYEEDAQLVSIVVFVPTSSVEKLLSRVQQTRPLSEAKSLEKERQPQPEPKPLIRRVEK